MTPLRRSRQNTLTAPEKMSLLLYHGVALYNSRGMLRSSNGLMNTLATNVGKKYDFTVQNNGEDVKLKTKVAITGTVIDEEPVAVCKIDKVLLPRDLFKGTAVEVADEPAAAPKAAKKKKKAAAKKGDDEDEDAEAPGSGPDSSEDYTDDNVANKTVSGGGRLVASAVMAV